MKPTGLKPGRQPGLGLEPRVEVARVLAHLGRGLRRRAERDHQPGRVPRRARRELVALERARRRVQPMCARWYATEQPMTPPPITTTRARAGSSVTAASSHATPTPTPTRRTVCFRSATGNLKQTEAGSTVGHVDETTLRGLYATVPTEFVGGPQRDGEGTAARQGARRGRAGRGTPPAGLDGLGVERRGRRARRRPSESSRRPPATSVTRRRRRSRAVTGSMFAPRCAPCANGPPT